MIKRLLYASFILFCLLAIDARASDIPVGEERRIEADVLSAFSRIVTLWQDEDYNALYEFGDETSRKILSLDKFAETTRNNSWKLACCWEKALDIEITIKKPTYAVVKARIGYQMRFDTGSTRFVMQTFDMTLQDGNWKIDLQEIAYQDPYLLPRRFPGLPIGPIE
jgi:hypothetical protein